MKTNASIFRSLAAAIALACGAVTQSSFAQTTDPVGFATLSISGTGGTQASAISFLGLSMARSTAFRSVAETVSGTTLTCSAANWTDNQYASTPAPGYYLEVFSGAKTGLMTQIVSCSMANKTVTVADDLTTLGVEATSVTFKIRPNWSIGTVFGATNNVAVDATSGLATGLASGATASRADLILLYNENTLGYDQFFYSTGTNSWQQVGGDGSDQANTPIHLHEGVVIKRKGTTNLTIALNGEVKLGQTIVPVTSAGAAAGFNFRSNIYPSGNLTMGNSGLYAGDVTGATGVLPGATASRADLVSIWNTATSGYDQYFFSTGTSTWQLVGGDGSDQAAVAIASGKSIIIRRKSGSFTWVIPQPFTVQP